MIWYAHTADAKLYIGAERWFEARQYALAILGEQVIVELSVSQGIVPDMVLEWVGSDYNRTELRMNVRIGIPAHATNGSTTTAAAYKAVPKKYRRRAHG